MTNLNVDPAEVAKFDRLASRWWDPSGESKPLHHLNPARLDYIASHARLEGLKVADIGCGGGILSEALAKAGASVTAIDMSEKALQVARMHAIENGLEIDYQLASAEELAEKKAGEFPLVCCMELLEHVPNPESLLASLAGLLQPGGTLVLSTLNRTAKSFLLGVVAAEYLLQLLPKGTHQYERFIRPSELAAMLRQAGLEVIDIAGLAYNPFSGEASKTAKPDINYMMVARKP